MAYELGRVLLGVIPNMWDPAHTAESFHASRMVFKNTEATRVPGDVPYRNRMALFGERQSAAGAHVACGALAPARPGAVPVPCAVEPTLEEVQRWSVGGGRELERACGAWLGRARRHVCLYYSNCQPRGESHHPRATWPDREDSCQTLQIALQRPS